MINNKITFTLLPALLYDFRVFSGDPAITHKTSLLAQSFLGPTRDWSVLTLRIIPAIRYRQSQPAIPMPRISLEYTCVFSSSILKDYWEIYNIL